MIIKLSNGVVEAINRDMIETYSEGEMIGVKDVSLLDSATNRPFQTAFGESLYKDIFEKAVALFESLAKNHVFQNANKRTAFASMVYFLFVNGHVCTLNEKEAADLTVDFVVGSLSFEDVVSIVKGHSYRKSSQS